MDRQTDGHMDGQNYDSQDRASIAASRGKKFTESNAGQNCSVFVQFPVSVAGQMSFLSPNQALKGCCSK